MRRVWRRRLVGGWAAERQRHRRAASAGRGCSSGGVAAASAAHTANLALSAHDYALRWVAAAAHGGVQAAAGHPPRTCASL